MLLSAFILWNSPSVSCQEKREYEVVSIAFYNLENLFDTYDDPNIFDDDRTPAGKDKWTEELYRKKLENMAFAIHEIGREQTNAPPALLGVSEVENRKVLEDLIETPLLAPYNYGIIHFDSPDERGIDVGLLYQKAFFIPLHWSSHELVLYEPKTPSKRDFTRDQLIVTGLLKGEEIHVMVNHWPSRSGGEKLSSHKRENAARLTRRISDSLFRINPYSRIIVMGDFNDDPISKSLSKVLGAKSKRDDLGLDEFYNPYHSIYRSGAGSSAYRDTWNLFDQILVSKTLTQKNPEKFSFFRAYIFDDPFLITREGQYKGYPFRSFGSTGFTGGYSDHFPVYILLIKELP
ncbi:MAG: endonuclease/exonuclease/phosphatase family protein [Salinimicrobium sediminis]|nr:endonuclease/exonuclease/phosphatase family protein [Salinimicrobium sediminis]